MEIGSACCDAFASSLLCYVYCLVIISSAEDPRVDPEIRSERQVSSV